MDRRRLGAIVSRWRGWAAFGLCLAALVAPAWAGVDLEASKACVKCHDSEDLPEWSRSAHVVPTDPRTPGCVTCHGASTDHLGGPSSHKPDRVFSNKSPLPAGERSTVCLGCHDRGATHALWRGSPHDTADLACTSCHQVHVNHDPVLAKATQVEVCYGCHKAQRMQVSRPSHHPIPEGKMVCTDCHSVHGSAGPKLVKKDSTNDTCYTCHAEKRGPFVHPHEPVGDDCASCHNPHGSTIAAMLKARPPMLCQQCHTPHVAGGVGAIGGQPGVLTPAQPGQAPLIGATSSGKNVINLWQGRSCTNCHTQVHGSNNPSATNPTPQFLFR